MNVSSSLTMNEATTIEIDINDAETKTFDFKAIGTMEIVQSNTKMQWKRKS